MEKVNLDVIKPWITKKLIEILGVEDDVVMQYVFNMLESEKVNQQLSYFSQPISSESCETMMTRVFKVEKSIGRKLESSWSTNAPH